MIASLKQHLSEELVLVLCWYQVSGIEKWESTNVLLDTYIKIDSRCLTS